MDPLDGFDEVDGVDLFQKLPLFRKLSFDETRRLAAIARAEQRRRGDVIVEEGALGSALYIVRSGTVVVTREPDEPGQREVSLGRLGPGELFGEMSLVDDALTSASVTALEDTELLVLPRAEFEALIASEPVLALKVYQAFCRNLCARLRRASPQPTTTGLKSGVY
jgi:CRP-like cAMP-binding protein